MVFLGLPLEQQALRIFIALIVGSLIGLERVQAQKPAGVRTHAVVCIVSAMLTLVSAYGFADFPGEVDPSRLIANILTGIGFLAGGVIYIVAKGEDKTVKGLTTAAGIWGVASLGIPIGLGHHFLVLITYVAIRIALKGERLFEKLSIPRLGRRKHIPPQNEISS